MLFSGPIYPISLSSNNNNFNSSSKDSIGLVSYLLIPVSLVDVFSINMILYSSLFYVLFVMLIPIVLLDVIVSYSYMFMYRNIS